MSFNKSWIIIIAIICIVFGSGCAKVNQSDSLAVSNNTENPAPISQDQLTAAANTTGIQLLKQICADGEEPNVILSPFSLSAILAVLQNGAQGETKEEFNTLINPGQLSAEELNQKYLTAIDDLVNAGWEDGGKKTTVIELANSLWINEHLPIKEPFLQASADYYHTEAFNVNFADKSTIPTMNRWIEEKTHGKITDHLTRLPNSPSLVAFNSLYFNGKWQSPFDPSKTKPEEFVLTNKNAIKVDMMNDTQWIGYYENEQAQIGKFGYYGCSMLIILPKGNIDDYISNLDNQQIQTAVHNAEDRKARVKFPKLILKQNNHLNEYLQLMGMKSAFDPKRADFSNMANNGLFIDSVSQECYMSIDEEGTEAAALTSVIMCGGAAPPKQDSPVEFYINKPFIFVINDDKNGLILFIGKVEDPQATDGSSNNSTSKIKGSQEIANDPGKVLTDDEFVFADGVRLGMTYEEVLQILDGYDEAYDNAPGVKSVIKDGIHYGFYQIDESFTNQSDFPRDDVYRLLNLSSESYQGKLPRGIKIGDNIEDVLNKFPGQDKTLRKWAYQMIYGKDEIGSPRAFLEFTMYNEAYRFVATTSKQVLEITFDRNNQVRLITCAKEDS